MWNPLLLLGFSISVSVYSVYIVLSKWLTQKNGVRLSAFEDDSGHDLKYIVALADVHFIRFCTGALIHSTWALTAAHCIDDVTEKDVVIWYKNFTASPKETGYYSEVLNIVSHPSYKQHLQNVLLGCQHDISLLQLREVALLPSTLSAVDYRSLTGYSVTYIASQKYSKDSYRTVLRRPIAVRGIVIKCDREDKAVRTVAPIVCVVSTCVNKIYPQFGDSGGPLIHAGKVAGVLAILSVNTVIVSGYTPVSPYIDWINSVIHSN